MQRCLFRLRLWLMVWLMVEETFFAETPAEVVVVAEVEIVVDG